MDDLFWSVFAYFPLHVPLLRRTRTLFHALRCARVCSLCMCWYVFVCVCMCLYVYVCVCVGLVPKCRTGRPSDGFRHLVRLCILPVLRCAAAGIRRSHTAAYRHLRGSHVLCCACQTVGVHIVGWDHGCYNRPPDTRLPGPHAWMPAHSHTDRKIIRHGDEVIKLEMRLRRLLHM